MRDGLNELHGHNSERGDINTESDDESDEERSNGHVRDLLAGYVLDALDPDETDLVAVHLSTCVTCRAELTDYETLVGVLPFAAPAHQVPLRVRAGLLAKIDEVGTANEEQMIVLRQESRSVHDTQRTWIPKFSLPQWSRARVASFASVPLLLLVALVIAMGDRISDQQNEISAIKQDQAAGDRVMSSIDPRDPAAVQEVIPSSAARDAQGRLIIDRESESGLLLVVGLPQPEEGQQYMVWLDFTDSDEYARFGTLTVEPDGRAKLVIDPSGSIMLYDRVIITAESDAEVTMPTGPELMTAGIMPGD